MSKRSNNRFLGLILILALLIVPSTTTGAADTATSVPTPPRPSDVPLAAPAGPIIIDHTCTDITKIPPYWIEEAKKLAIHYAHTSHGSQIMTGISHLEGLDPTYAITVTYANSSPPAPLPGLPDAIRIYDGNPPDTYITPELYWATPGGISRTQYVAGTGVYSFSMWSWCGQQSSNSTETVQLYLDTLDAFEVQFSQMRFILMTGHTDGGSQTLARNNNMVRQYALDQGKILFDFADIETYAPDGSGPYDNNGEGTCTWCEAWCTDHSDYCLDIPSSCAHSSSLPYAQLFCKLKGNAFWWMMARLAGWDGVAQGESTKSASPQSAFLGQPVTYTIVVQNLAAPLTATAFLTDTVPAGLAYVPGSLGATAGTVDDSAAPTLHWSGTLTPTPAVTITYVVTVSTSIPQTIVNTADIVVPGYQAISRSAAVEVTMPPGQPDLGPSFKAASPQEAGQGEPISYTLVLRNTPGPLSMTVYLTDTVPAGLAYVPGSLGATAGTVDDSAAPTLRWSGTLTPTPVVTISYVVTVSTATPQTIVNTADIVVPGYQAISRSASITVLETEQWVLYLPLMFR